MLSLFMEFQRRTSIDVEQVDFDMCIVIELSEDSTTGSARAATTRGIAQRSSVAIREFFDTGL